MQHGVYFVFHMRFRLLVVFAPIFPINIILTEFAMTAFDLMHKVISFVGFCFADFAGF